VGFYYAGSALKAARGPVDIALGAAAAIAVAAFIVWLRRNARRLAEQAERAYPGPLARYMKNRPPREIAPEHRSS
jgi:uncharacterized membrane protein YccC